MCSNLNTISSVLTHFSLPAVLRVVSEVLQGRIAEEVEAIGIVISAIHTANPEHAIAWLQEGCAQLLHFALPHLHLGVVEEEVAGLSQLLNLHRMRC